MGRGGLQDEAGGADEDARARDAMYERAERLAASLARMGEQLRTAIDNVNAASASQVSVWGAWAVDKPRGTAVVLGDLVCANQSRRSRCLLNAGRFARRANASLKVSAAAPAAEAAPKKPRPGEKKGVSPCGMKSGEALRATANSNQLQWCWFQLCF